MRLGAKANPIPELPQMNKSMNQQLAVMAALPALSGGISPALEILDKED